MNEKWSCPICVGCDNHKFHSEIEFADSLPKTISGKIRRVELREMERQKKLGK